MCEMLSKPPGEVLTMDSLEFELTANLAVELEQWRASGYR